MDTSESQPLEPIPAAPLPLPPLPGLIWPYSERPVRPPRVWTVFVAVFGALAAGMFASSLVPVAAAVVEHHATFESRQEFLQAVGQTLFRPAILLGAGAATQLTLLTVALGAAFLSPVSLVKRLRLGRSSLPLWGYPIALLGALSVSLLFSSIVQLLRIPEFGTLKMFSDVFSHLTPVEIFFAVLVVGVGPGFAEEFLFRGYAQTRLVQRWGCWAGIIIASLLFGVAHMDLLQSPFAAGFGLYLGYLAEKTGSIRPTMFCHMANNGIQVLLGALATGAAASATAAEPSRAGAAIMGAVALIVLVCACLFLRYAVKSPPTDNQGSGPLSVPIR